MPWTFGLPPYAVDTFIKTDDLKGILKGVGFGTFKPMNTYGDLIRDLLQGRVHAAWATPHVCATVEEHGGRVVVRALRQGMATYRSVLFARKDRQLTVDLLKGLKAAWPDAQSMSGYVLPRTLLFAMGHDPVRELHKDVFLGSFKACVEAVLDKRADISATDASASDAARKVDGFEVLAGPRAGELVALAYTPDCPHGGIILSPQLKPGLADKIANKLLDLMHDQDVVGRVTAALGVDSFEVPPEKTYAALREFLTAPTRKLHVKLA